MWFILVVYLVGHVQAATWTDPVDSPAGLIRGIAADDGDYFMYLGIPYAKVNEDNPFGPSTKQPKFNGVFDAVDDTTLCPQEKFDGSIAETLDCLHVHVYVPNTTETKLPVLVWIHGGAYTSGFGGRELYGPKFLVRHDVIVVSVNYRLGVYGFMCLDIPEVPGNQGLKDQYLALKWIYENIESFGGDVEKITLMGESAGAMSIDLHMSSKYPKLYHQAILQSGTGLVPGLIRPPDNTVPLKVAEHLGFITDDVLEALSFLAKTHIGSVMTATIELNIGLPPCVEKKFENVEQIIHIHPEHNNITKVSDMRILAGFNSHEQIYMYINKPIEDIQESFFHDYVAQEYNTEELEDMIHKVRRFYIGDKEISSEVIWELIDFASDVFFNHPVQRSIMRYLDSGAHVYQYMFSYDGDRNYVKVMTNVLEKGAAHADELGYLFDMIYLPETPTILDQLVIDRMTTMWTNFVKFGNPTPSTSELLPLSWTPVSRDVISYLDINSNLTLGTSPYHARMSFWDLFHAANKHKLLANINAPSSSFRFSSSVFYSLLIVVVLNVLRI